MMPVIYALSDSIGETAEMVARAALSQFETTGMLNIVRMPYIHTAQQITDILHEAAKQPCIICHTLVSPELREALLAEAKELNVTTVDIMGPMINAVQNISGLMPRLKPGLVHKLDQEYFKRVEAVEFAVKHDDGKNPWGLGKADIILIGVSRTSKTPLSMYLAHKKLKVANIPLVPELAPPEELFRVLPTNIIGLIIDPVKLNEIRSERLKVMGLSMDASYANINRINEELKYAQAIMGKLACPVIDVSNKAIEETATEIQAIMQQNKISEK